MTESGLRISDFLRGDLLFVFFCAVGGRPPAASALREKMTSFFVIFIGFCLK